MVCHINRAQFHVFQIYNIYYLRPKKYICIYLKLRIDKAGILDNVWDTGTESLVPLIVLQVSQEIIEKKSYFSFFFCIMIIFFLFSFGAKKKKLVFDDSIGI